MAPNYYRAKALVLKKTKLREKDLILELLDESGALISAVAKGARRPGGSHGAKLELFSTVNLLLAKGKTLDTICESALISRCVQEESPEATFACAPIAELLTRVAQKDLAVPKLFSMTESAFQIICAEDVSRPAIITAAALLKIMGVLGWGCISSDWLQELADQHDFLPDLNPELLNWCDYLFSERFAAIAQQTPSPQTLEAILLLTKKWCEYHCECSIRSLPILINSLKG